MAASASKSDHGVTTAQKVPNMIFVESSIFATGDFNYIVLSYQLRDYIEWRFCLDDKVLAKFVELGR